MATLPAAMSSSNSSIRKEAGHTGSGASRPRPKARAQAYRLASQPAAGGQVCDWQSLSKLQMQNNACTNCTRRAATGSRSLAAAQAAKLVLSADSTAARQFEAGLSRSTRRAIGLHVPESAAVSARKDKPMTNSAARASKRVEANRNGSGGMTFAQSTAARAKQQARRDQQWQDQKQDQKVREETARGIADEQVFRDAFAIIDESGSGEQRALFPSLLSPFSSLLSHPVSSRCPLTTFSLLYPLSTTLHHSPSLSFSTLFLSPPVSPLLSLLASRLSPLLLSSSPLSSLPRVSGGKKHPLVSIPMPALFCRVRSAGAIEAAAVLKTLKIFGKCVDTTAFWEVRSALAQRE